MRFAAPPDVACLLKARGLQVPDRFFVPIVGAVGAGLTLLVMPPLGSALAHLLATIRPAARIFCRPDGRRQMRQRGTQRGNE